MHAADQPAILPNAPSLSRSAGSVTACCVERLREQLRNSQYHQLRRLECDEARSGLVRIRGQVPTFYLKQMAHTVATIVCGPGLVLDEVEVPQEAQLSR